MRKTLVAAVAAVIVGIPVAQAGEGMWTPQQLPEISRALKDAGLKLDPNQLADLTGDPLGAVVSLGGCTASFVSPQGLVATNHHCAYGAIQLNSSAKSNLMATGFNAKTMADEVSAGPAQRIYALERIDDVTSQVRAAITAAKTPIERTRAVETLEKQLLSVCETGGGYRCRLYSFMGGNTYRLFKYLEIRDVRLVYAPPSSIGNFGGEVDNWMWPRHAGDFSFLRAYVGKDGKPAAYSKDNVPYRPKHWLKIADQPLLAGDFVMVAGYPGTTSRYALVDEFQNTQDWLYPTISRTYKELVAMVQATGAKNPDVAVKYASTMRGWENTLKNFDGQLEGFRRTNALATKQAEESAVLAWLKKQRRSGEAALAAYNTIETLNVQSAKTRERDLTLPQVGGTLGSTAVQLYRLSIERAKPDAQREAGYQQRDVAGIEAMLKQMDRRYDAGMDSQLQAYWLNRYARLPADQHVDALDGWIAGSDAKAIADAVARMHKSALGKDAERMKWLSADRAAFEASNDPAIKYAVAVMPTLLKLEEARKTRAGELLAARPVYLKALADYRKAHGKAVYPDANSSLRITFGKVTGYTKLDGSKQAPFTVVEEIVAKTTGKEPFDTPKAVLDAIKAKRYAGLIDPKLGSVPVDFLSDLDITGGNSGSPVLDAHGKLVGLAFDGNWESVASNWVFDPVMTRMIAMDQRYMRWVMTVVDPAPQLLQEMGVPAGK
ncbi:S46 family peptidase [Solilutibacter silvestris]|uniref:Dipeptidyl-peptidase n=1 Tax=Solilutibacter silvestris TaxID=1645665 RepID=A0A2K1Q3S1_9GAMM|nr:S46 family peptidase [Lysobacter silvestris]PNS09597.1 Peptidase S46 [Lysobacter silvestris]